MKPERIGHVVLKVRSLERSVPFYRDVLGFTVSATHGPMVFFTATGENHHDLALMEVGDQAAPPLARSVGLYHVAIKLPSEEDVRAAARALAERQIPIGASDHGVSRSIYLADPDGIEIELYADVPPEEYGGDVSSAMTVRPWDPS